MTRTTAKRQTRSRPGAVAVEMALLLPFLALLFSTTLDFARIFHTTQALQNAACSGAMTASGTAWTPGYPATALDAARTAACAESNTLEPALVPGNVAVTVAGGMATVTVSYDFPLMSAALVPSMKVRLERTVTVPVAARPGD